MASEEVSGSSRVPLLGKENTTARGRGALYAILFLSLVVNVIFITREKAPPEWQAEAVLDAQVAAMEWCSGHGDVFVDTMEVSVDGKPVCECHECFTGPDCSIATANCVANADV
jgi:hypothetical protein